MAVKRHDAAEERDIAPIVGARTASITTIDSNGLICKSSEVEPALGNITLPAQDAVIQDDPIATASGLIEDAVSADTDDDLRPGRGLVMGALFSIPLWGAIALLIWFFLGR